MRFCHRNTRNDKRMKRLALISIFTILCFVSENLGKTGFGPGEQEWGFVQVHPHASLFWWLFYTTAKTKSYYDKPLIIWLQGGPGQSASGYGNFEELGPLYTNLKLRNYTWVKDYNVLFIDNPVGAGFSDITDESAYATSNTQIADQLLECMQEFYKQLPRFKSVPTYITGQSYGGKMGVQFALVWYRAQRKGSIKSNLKGIALGNPWISPGDSVMAWAPYLLAIGMIDTGGYERIKIEANKTVAKIKADRWQEAATYCVHTQGTAKIETFNADFYNILKKKIYAPYPVSSDNIFSSDPETVYQNFIKLESISLEELMNGPVKKALNLTVDYGRHSNTVFLHLWNDFMKPTTYTVEQLLNETSLQVFVYTGHLDLFVPSPGTVRWVERLNWKDAHAWRNSTKSPLLSDGLYVEGFKKVYKNFGMYWINRAGHEVPQDNPVAMSLILQELTSNAYNERTNLQ